MVKEDGIAITARIGIHHVRVIVHHAVSHLYANQVVHRHPLSVLQMPALAHHAIHPVFLSGNKLWFAYLESHGHQFGTSLTVGAVVDDVG